MHIPNSPPPLLSLLGSQTPDAHPFTITSVSSPLLGPLALGGAGVSVHRLGGDAVTCLRGRGWMEMDGDGWME